MKTSITMMTAAITVPVLPLPPPPWLVVGGAVVAFVVEAEVEVGTEEVVGRVPGE